MDVLLKERAFSFSAEYNIETCGKRYTARKAFFSFRDRLTLVNEAGRQLARIQGFVSPIRHRHEFFLADGRTYRFHCEKFWKRVFLCIGSDGFYALYAHKGLHFSIFKNDRQIAAFTKNRIALLKGNTYSIQMDQDADLVLILCLVLTFNTVEQGRNDQQTVSIDLGNFWEEKPFDSSWQPR